MLQNFYHFREQPFGVNPDPRFLYLGRTHREAFASLLYRIEMDSGFLAMIAQPGMGKTTLLFHLLRRLQATAKTAFIFQTQCTSNELLRHLISEFECDTEITDSVRISRELKTFMLAEANAGRRCVLVIDEAQNLGPEVLETIRLLSNFETPRRKLLNIILSGQSELREMLVRPELQQLRQRLSCIVRIERFTPGETALYIAHRLSVAGYPGKVSELFNLHALAKVAQLSHGVPRIINNLCFNALSVGYALGRGQIDVDMIDEVASDLGLSGESWLIAPISQEPPRDSTDVFSEVSSAFIRDEHSEAESTGTAAEMAEAPVSGKGTAAGIDVGLNGRSHDPDQARIIPVETCDPPVSDHINVGSHKNVPPRASGTLLARGLLCALVLLLTPAIDLPANLSVSAHSTEVMPTAVPELAAHRGEKPRQSVRRSHAPNYTDSSIRATGLHAPSVRHSRIRHSPPPASGDSRMLIDLAPASFVPEPLLKPQLVAPTVMLARSPAPVASVSGGPSPSASTSRQMIKSPRKLGGYVPPNPIWQPAPANPYGAKHRYPAEDVQLVLFVSRDGEVYDVGVLRGDGALASAAKKAVREWKYTPALSNGTPVNSKIFVTVQFRRQ